MLPTAIVEQQAKLGVSAEDSKAQRLKRLQARFRDRGGSVSPFLCLSYPPLTCSPTLQGVRTVQFESAC